MNNPEVPSDSSEPRSEDLKGAVPNRFRRIGPQALSALATLSALLVGFLGGLYYPYVREHHQLNASVSSLSCDFSDSTISIDVVFWNRGNRHEVVMAAYFELPWGRNLDKGSHWDSQHPHVKLAPVVLGPGEAAVRHLEQPISLESVIGFKQRRPDAKWIDDSTYQVVALGVSVLGVDQKVRHTRIPLIKVPTDGSIGWFGVGARDMDAALLRKHAVNLLAGEDVNNRPAALEGFETVPGTLPHRE